MIRRPVQDAIEAYAAERFGITDVNVAFTMEDESGIGDDRPDWVFVVTVTGWTDGGEPFDREFGGDEAAEFMHLAMSWERLS